MGLLDDSRRAAEERRNIEAATHASVHDAETSRLQGFLNEFVTAATREGIESRPLLETKSHWKDGFFGTKSWETAEPIGYGWLVSISRYSNERGNGSYLSFAEVVSTDGMILSSSHLQQATLESGRVYRGSLHQLDLHPGAQEPIAGKWTVRNTGALDDDFVVQCGEFFAAYAAGQPIAEL